MSRGVLFVVAEIGAARYLLPLWRRWLAAGRSDWNIVLSTVAGRYLDEQGFAAGLPVVARLDQKATDIMPAIEEVAPSTFVVSAGFGHPLEGAAVKAARSIGAPVVQFVDSWINYAVRFTHDDVQLLPDRIAMIDQNAIAEAVEDGLPKEILRIVGQPSWEMAAPLPPAPMDRAIFLTGPVRAQYGDSLGYDEWSCWALVKEAAATYPDLIGEVWYGRHPVQVEITTETVAPARLVTESMAALAEVGIVLGEFSSPMIDALIGGRRVVSIQPDAKGKDMCPLSRHGRIRRVGTAAQLADALREPSRGGQDLARILKGSLDRMERFVEEARR